MGVDLISSFFYLPANGKYTEEERVAFTRARLAEVNEWLSHDFVRDRPGGYHYADMDGEIIRWKMLITDDRKVYINRNWWNMCIDWFCEEHKCKLADTDLLYLVMLLYRQIGFDVKPVDGSLCVSLFAPWRTT